MIQVLGFRYGNLFDLRTPEPVIVGRKKFRIAGAGYRPDFRF